MTNQESAVRGHGKKSPPAMRMEPMIDCVFLLLIFFMVSTSFSPMPGIRVKLPPPGRPTSTKPKGLILRIASPEAGSDIGDMIINEEYVKMENLYGRFISASESAKKMLIIQSARDVLHKQVVQIMDMAKRANIKKIGFAMVARGSGE